MGRTWKKSVYSRAVLMFRIIFITWEYELYEKLSTCKILFEQTTRWKTLRTKTIIIAKTRGQKEKVSTSRRLCGISFLPSLRSLLPSSSPLLASANPWLEQAAPPASVRLLCCRLKVFSPAISSFSRSRCIFNPFLPSSNKETDRFPLFWCF